MSETKRLFVVSDIHGHGTLLKKELEAAGFDPHNPNHLFVCCGDLFDRGRENRMVYELVTGLKHKVLVKGNHDERLRQILTQKSADVYDLYNGIEMTLVEFFGAGSVGEYGELRLPEGDEMADKLCSLVDRMVDYFETEHYVFVHGWLPVVRDGSSTKLAEDWRHAGAEAWRNSRFLEWMSCYKTEARLPDKTIICGHRPTRLAAMVDSTRAPANADPYYAEGMIAIDGGTIRSGQVNLLVLEDTLLGDN